MGGFVLSKIIGLARQSIIAQRFGTGQQLDAYYAAFKLPDLVLTLIAGGAIATTFIPVFSGYLTKGQDKHAWRLASAVLNILLLLMGAVASIAAASAPLLVRRYIAPGFDASLQALTAELLRIVLLSSVVFAASSLVMSVLQAHQRFVLPALADFFYDVGIIFGALFLVPSMGIHGLAWGVVIGASLHLLIQLPGLIRCRARYALTLWAPDDSLQRLGQLMGPRILILGMFQVVLLFTTSLASGLPEGTITAINMGWILMQMPEVIFAMAIATAAFPVMSRLATQKEKAALRATISGALKAILLLSSPSTLALLMLGRRYIALFFGYGAFDARSADMVYWTTAAFTVGLVGHSMLELAARIYYAHRNTLVPFVVAVGATIANISLCVVLAAPLGGAGLALANSIAVTIQSIVLLWLGWKSLVQFDVRSVLGLLWRTGIALVAMSAAIWWVTQREDSWGTVWTAVAASLLGGLAYATLVGLLNYREARRLVQVLCARVGTQNVKR
jgi:putative peptidoglycan lipid II flippase